MSARISSPSIFSCSRSRWAPFSSHRRDTLADLVSSQTPVPEPSPVKGKSGRENVKTATPSDDQSHTAKLLQAVREILTGMAHEHIVQWYLKALGQVLDGLRIKMAMNEYQFDVDFRIHLV
jgi:hypothetical protein